MVIENDNCINLADQVIIGAFEGENFRLSSEIETPQIDTNSEHFS